MRLVVISSLRMDDSAICTDLVASCYKAALGGRLFRRSREAEGLWGAATAGLVDSGAGEWEGEEEARSLAVLT